MPLRPAPGEKLQVVLGGDGIDVTGQLVAENQPAEFDYHYADNYRRPGGRGSNRRKLWPPAYPLAERLERFLAEFAGGASLSRYAARLVCETGPLHGHFLISELCLAT